MPGVFLIITGYMDCHRQVAAIVLLSLSMGFCGFQFSSFFINHGDIAPKYAGTVFGFTNTGASVPGIIAPYIVGAITTHVSTFGMSSYLILIIPCFNAQALTRKQDFVDHLFALKIENDNVHV